MKKYKCMNVGNDCDYANKGTEFEIAEGEKLECPKCHMEMLAEVKGPNWKLIGGIAVGLLLCAVIGFSVWSIIGSDPEIDKIKLDKKNITLVAGQKDVIKATVVDKDGNEIKDAKVKFSWSVKDDKIASITQGGEVDALKKGKTSITVKIEGDEKNHRATCQVEVKDPSGPQPPVNEGAIEQIAIKDAKDFTLKVKGTKTLAFEALPENHKETPVWESSDPSVATVDANGLVTAVKEGETTISIVAKKVSASVKVTVKKNEGGDDDNKHMPDKINLGYGIYEGPCKGGKAHGVGGEVRITRSYSLDLKKAPTEFVQLNSGDRIVNTKFVNGQLKQGEIHFSDGRRKWINL